MSRYANMPLPIADGVEVSIGESEIKAKGSKGELAFAKPEVVKGITTGLVFWDKNVIDWDYLEWFLGAHHLHHIPEWIMPTAQACLANRCQSKTVCPKQIRNLYPKAKIAPQTFGLHLLGSYREQWLKALPDEAHQRGEKINPQNTIFQPCQKQGIFGYTARQTKRWINTRLNIW